MNPKPICVCGAIKVAYDGAFMWAVLCPVHPASLNASANSLSITVAPKEN